MAPTMLALTENISTQLLLTSRLEALGYQVTALTTAATFDRAVEASGYDWILLDAAGVPRPRQRFLQHLRKHCGSARIVWCGAAPPTSALAIVVTFDRPLAYKELAQYFARWASPRRAASAG